MDRVLGELVAFVLIVAIVVVPVLLWQFFTKDRD